MRSSPLRAGALLVLTPLLLALGSCRYLYPEPDPQEEAPRRSDDPLFAAEDYAKNAKEYFDGGQYLRAREQWTTQLKKEPGNWMAELGVASCDYFLGSQALDRQDARTAREQLSRAETQCRTLWNGQLGKDTRETDLQPVQPWKAALVLARSLRALGDADNVEARIATQRLGTMNPGDPKRDETETERTRLLKQRNENHRAALDIFEKLVAMEHCSEDAVLNAAELYVTFDRIPEAEARFLQYLDIAENTRKEREAVKEQIAKAGGKDPATDRLSTRFLEEKIASNATKQAAVLVRLGNIHYDRGEASRQRAEDATVSAEDRAAARSESKKGFSRALDYLARAQELKHDRSDIFVKMAQCQGELGLFEPAIANLDNYIRDAADRSDPFDDNLKKAYRMKREYQTKLQAQRK